MTLERLVEPLLFLARSYLGGREGHACSIVQSLFNGYLSVEELFNENAQVRLWVCLLQLFTYLDTFNKLKTPACRGFR